MLTIVVPETEFFDDDKQEFVQVKKFVLNLEHSLVSLSKWESKWEKPFLSEDKKSPAETLSYIEMMILNKKTPSNLFQRLSPDQFQEIDDYINSKQSATWFSELAPPKSKEVITNELIYHWMFAAGIDMKCEEWHLNRLFTLIKIVGLKRNTKPKKMTRSELASRKSLNEQRRAKLGTTG